MTDTVRIIGAIVEIMSVFYCNLSVLTDVHVYSSVFTAVFTGPKIA